MNNNSQKAYLVYSFVVVIIATISFVLLISQSNLGINRSNAGVDSTAGDFNYKYEDFEFEKSQGFLGLDYYTGDSAKDQYTLIDVASKSLNQVNFSGGNLPSPLLLDLCIILDPASGEDSKELCNYLHVNGFEFSWEYNLPDILINEGDEIACRIGIISNQQLGYDSSDFLASEFSCGLNIVPLDEEGSYYEFANLSYSDSINTNNAESQLNEVNIIEGSMSSPPLYSESYRAGNACLEKKDSNDENDLQLICAAETIDGGSTTLNFSDFSEGVSGQFQASCSPGAFCQFNLFSRVD